MFLSSQNGQFKLDNDSVHDLRFMDLLPSWKTKLFVF